MKYFYLTCLMGTTLLFGDTLKNDSEWKEKEDMAKSEYTPVEQLVLLKEEKNPFIKKALLSNEKYNKLNNKDILKIEENRTIFDVKVMSIKKDLDNIDEKLSRLLFFLKHRKAFDENRVKEFQEQLIKTNKDYHEYYVNRKRDIEKIYAFKKNKIEEKIEKYNSLLTDKNNEFKEKLKTFINLEKDKTENVLNKLEMRTEISKDNLSKVRHYLSEIDKSIFYIKESEIDKELIDTIHPELLALKEIYLDKIIRIQNKMGKILAEKNAKLREIETDTVKKIENEKKIKILEVEEDLKTKYIKSKYLYLKKELEFKEELELAKLKLSKEKGTRQLTLETNDLNLNIYKNTKIYDDLAKRNKDVANDIKEIKVMLENYKMTKDLIVKKSKLYSNIINSNDSSIQEKLKVASNKGTHPDLLTELSKSPFWIIREGVASNPNTPIAVLKTLTKDKNIFVKNKSESNIKTQKARQELLGE